MGRGAMSEPQGRQAGSPKGIGSFLSLELGRLALLTVAIFLVMSALDPSTFLSFGNLSSMAFQFPEFAILSLAMMLAMMTGGIDLSIVGIANLSAVVAALILASLAGPAATGLHAASAIALAAAAAIGIGAVMGLLNGVAIGFFGLPPILASLGSGLVFTGLAVAITGGSAVLGFPPAFAFLGNGSVLGIPVPLVVVLVLGLGVWFLLERT